MRDAVRVLPLLVLMLVAASCGDPTSPSDGLEQRTCPSNDISCFPVVVDLSIPDFVGFPETVIHVSLWMVEKDTAQILGSRRMRHPRAQLFVNSWDSWDYFRYDLPSDLKSVTVRARAYWHDAPRNEALVASDSSALFQVESVEPNDVLSPDTIEIVLERR